VVVCLTTSERGPFGLTSGGMFVCARDLEVVGWLRVLVWFGDFVQVVHYFAVVNR